MGAIVLIDGVSYDFSTIQVQVDTAGTMVPFGPIGFVSESDRAVWNGPRGPGNRHDRRKRAALERRHR